MHEEFSELLAAVRSAASQITIVNAHTVGPNVIKATLDLMDCLNERIRELEEVNAAKD